MFYSVKCNYFTNFCKLCKN